MKMNKKGFTIVELVIVIAVIAILAGVLIPTFSGIVENAQESARMQEVRNALTSYIAENNGNVADGTCFVCVEESSKTDEDVIYKYEYSNGKLSKEAAVEKGEYTKAVEDNPGTTDVNEAKAATFKVSDEKTYTFAEIKSGEEIIPGVWTATVNP